VAEGFRQCSLIPVDWYKIDTIEEKGTPHEITGIPGTILWAIRVIRDKRNGFGADTFSDP
jgi:hypothetical protein